jgi:hypothetical protein
MLLSYATNEPDRLVEALVDVLTVKLSANTSGVVAECDVRTHSGTSRTESP